MLGFMEEAKIIADAGVPGAVTIATNMAGRGTDIQLGGNVDMRVSEAETNGGTLTDKIKDKITLEVSSAKGIALDAEDFT